MSRIAESKQAGSGLHATWSGQSDEQLLLAYRSAGEVAAFEELVHRFERELYSFLFRYLGEATLAEDAFQATFLQLHLKRDQFEAGRKVRPWLYTIAVNQAIDAQRRVKRHRNVSLDERTHWREGDENRSLLELLVSSEPEAAANVDRDERREWVRQAVHQLPEPLRNVAILIYYQGLKYREAAEALDIPIGTVKSRMNAALHKLHEAWNQTHSLEHD